MRHTYPKTICESTYKIREAMEAIQKENDYIDKLLENIRYMATRMENKLEERRAEVEKV